MKGWNYCSRVIYSAKVFSLVQHLQSSAITQEQSSLLLIQGIAGEYTECLHMLFTQWNHPECATNVCKYVCYCWHNSQAPNECSYSRTLWLLHQLPLFFQPWPVPAHIFLEMMMRDENDLIYSFTINCNYVIFSIVEKLLIQWGSLQDIEKQCLLLILQHCSPQYWGWRLLFCLWTWAAQRISWCPSLVFWLFLSMLVLLFCQMGKSISFQTQPHRSPEAMNLMQCWQMPMKVQG